ncbi:MAG: hypothetical protein MUO87_10355 [Thermoplasmata archaeon]|nr:hypothetical protein [Thermoplasmata archaeon]
MASYPQYPAQFFMSKRPMTQQECEAAVAAVKTQRSAVMALVFVSIFVAAFSQSMQIGIVSLVTIAVAGVTVALIAKYLSVRARLKKTLVDGTVIDLRGVPQLTTNPTGWTIGPVRVQGKTELSKRLVQGRPATFVCLPGLKVVVSVDGSPLKYSLTFTAPANAWDSAVMPQTHPPAPALSEEPPPPED